MKQSIEHLPKETKEELTVILSMIRHYVKDSNMVILYGSYARNTYVLWDERLEFGVHTSYQSDYDILVVISNLNTKITEEILRHKLADAYHNHFASRRHATPRFIVENIKTLNQNLERSQYFFTDIVREGILLYDDKQFVLSVPRHLNYREIKDFAESEFDRYYPSAISMLDAISTYFMTNKDYMNAAFLLHQVCEKFYYVILLVWTNYRPKNHKLDELAAMVKGFARELSAVFPLDSQESIDCYALLCSAYIDARYNKDYKITREQMEYLLSRVDLLKDITFRICNKKLASYERMISGKAIYPLPDEGTLKVAEDGRKESL